MPDTETSTRDLRVQRLPPLAASAVLPPPPDGTLPAPGHCANCGATLTGPYCARCGQHVTDYHRSTWRFVADFFDNALCWDNKLFRTLGPLIRHPGFLTLEFMRGRRVRYVHPLRLFLFTSAVCLAILQFTHNHTIRAHVNPSGKPGKDKGGIHVDFGGASPSTDTPAPTPAAAAAVDPSPTSSPAPDTAKDDADAAATSPQETKSLTKQLKRELAKQRAERGKGGRDELGEKINEIVETKIEAAGNKQKFADDLVKNIQQRLSWVALALLPIFALLLRAVYWRKDSYYFAHLVFSLHYHTFLLIYLALYSIAQTVADYMPLKTLLSLLLLPLALSPPIYLYLSLRRMFAESKRRTVIKVLVLGSLHLVLVVIGVSVVGTYAFFF